MKKIINFLLALYFIVAYSCLMSGCISSKHLQKHDITKDTSVVDKSEVTTVTEEKADTTVFTKADTTTFSVTTTDTSTVIMDNATSRIEARYNKRTHKVDVLAIEKPKAVTLLVDKKTEVKQKNNITAKGKEEDKAKTLDKSTFSFPWWFWLILALIAAGWLVWKFYLKKLLFPIKVVNEITKVL